MKLHLPKVLVLALLGTTVAVAADLKYDSQSPASTYEIGLGNDTSTLLNTKKGEAGVTISSGQTVGTYVDGKLVCDAIGSVSTSQTNDLIIQRTVGLFTTRTETGDLTITGSGQVAVGGAYKNSSGTTTAYSRLTAEDITVEGDGSVVNLKASIVKADTLTLKSGKVEIHTGSSDFSQGNAYLGIMSDTAKQAQIKKSISISGGNLTIGSTAGAYVNASAKHYVMGFGDVENYTPIFGHDSFKFQQTGGVVKVYGDTIAQKNFSIIQSGDAKSEMYFSDDLAIMGKATITQSSTNKESTLIIGRITDYNLDKLTEGLKSVNLDSLGEALLKQDIAVSIEQTGAGKIQLASGTDFGLMSGTVSISQSGGGQILIGGGIDKELVGVRDIPESRSEFTSTKTTYSIEQNENGGTIVLAAGAEITASEVKLNSATGTMYVEQGAKLNADTITINGGTLVNGYVEPVATLDVEGDINSLSDTMSMLSTVETGGIKGNVVVKSGEYVEYGNLEGLLTIDGGQVTLNEDASVGGIVVNGGKLAVAGDATTGSITVTSGTIEFDSSTQLTLVENATISIADGVKVVVKMSAEDLVKLNNGEDVSITLFDSATSTLEFDNTLITFTDGEQSVDKTVTGSATGGAVTVTGSIPEPTTATLSLLALAALASRRRRK